MAVFLIVFVGIIANVPTNFLHFMLTNGTFHNLMTSIDHKP